MLPLPWLQSAQSTCKFDGSNAKSGRLRRDTNVIDVDLDAIVLAAPRRSTFQVSNQTSVSGVGSAALNSIRLKPACRPMSSRSLAVKASPDGVEPSII
jgi:hypothetical protein